MDIDQSIVDLWFHYEQIAMHFNELIIQYRLQLMGGAGAIGAISVYLIGSKVEPLEMRLRLRVYISTGLLILLCSAAYLDLYYYNELLRGAVDSIIELEEQYEYLNMSTSIKNRFPGNGTSRIVITYSLILLTLLAFTIWTWVAYFCGRNKSKDEILSQHRVSCPECAELILPKAKKCRFCGAKIR